MLQWQRWSPWQQDSFGSTTKIDLGNGQTIRAIDVVDGHAQRLRKAGATNDHRQSGNDLTTAVRVIAPQVAPLTDLARDIAKQTTTTQPASKFRHDLQQALESSHRQQSVRRTLGIQPPAKKDKLWWQASWLWVAFVALLVVVGIGLVGRKAKTKR